MASKTFATNDVLSAADMNLFGLDPQSSDVTTEQSTTSSSYTDLSTVGPSVTLSVNNGQKLLVFLSAYALSTTADVDFYASFVATGGVVVSASDTNAAKFRESSVGSSLRPRHTMMTLVTATSTGSTTFTMKYRSNGTANVTFGGRRIIVLPKF